jgi:hypothetical protein
LLKELVDQPLSAGDRIRLAFGLGELWEAIGEPDKAIQAWSQANSMLGQNFDEEHHHQLVNRVIAEWTPDLSRELPVSQVDGEELVFIVGMPRAGINLVETVLAAHPSVFPAGRNPHLGQLVDRLPLQLGQPWPDCMSRFKGLSPTALSRKLLETWRRASGRSQRICISDPLNYRYLGLISFLYPRARIIHVERNPVDNLLSCFSRPLLGREHGFACRLEDLVPYWKDYKRLMAHWRRVLDVSMLEVRYEDLVGQPAQEIARLVGFLGLRGAEVCQTFFEVPPRFGAPAPQESPRPMDARRVGRSDAFRPWIAPVLEAETGP